MATAKLEEAVKSTVKSRRARGEEGYILVAVLFMVVLILIALSLAAPKVAADLERDREVELMHRGKQYQRAIQLYYRKFQRYPPNMEGLEKSNEIRFLRRRYVDPITRKEEWHLIHFGEAKSPTMGMFGQAIGGTGAVAGTGPGGAFQGIGTPIGGTTSNDPNATTPANPATPNAPTDPNNPGSPGSGAQGGGNGMLGGSIFGSGTTGGDGPTIGGGGIIGVESTSPKVAILEYKKKTHFNEWEFVYDPLADRITVSGNAGTIGQPIGTGNTGAPGFPTTPGGGNLTPVPPAQPNPTPQQ
jgi:type II secretory pathway pseudopilin PulG